MDPQTQTQTPQLRNKKVLIVEDEQFISELYVQSLTRAGYEVEVIGDGLEALAAAQTNAYDIILLDIMLPNLTGTEILKKLRDKQESPNFTAKIIITTNLEMDEQLRTAIESQADGYLVKAEVTPKELVTYLDQLNQTS